MNPEKFGAFLRDTRKEKGLTQEQLAEKLGVSQKSVSRWETGKTMPDYSLLPSICEALGVHVAELLGGTRIEGDSVPKGQVTIMAQNLIALANNKKGIRRLLGALLSAIVMLVSAVALYNLDFCVAVESTVDLENAINEYHFQNEVSADVLERRAIGNRLYVLYGQNQYPGASGLACLEKGIFGKYRFLNCVDCPLRWINATKVTVGKTSYCVTYCVNDLPGIDAYGLCGVEETNDRNLTVEDAALLTRLDYTGAPFLTFTQLPDGVILAPYQLKYYQNGVEIPRQALEEVLGPHQVEGAPNSGTTNAEPWMVYVLEGILFLLGMMFIRFFLTDDHKR